MANTDRIISITLALCSVVFAGILVKREFFDSNAGPLTAHEAPPRLVGNWEQLRAEAIPLTSPNAPVVIVEFADLECPACRQFHSQLKNTVNDLNANVGLLMIHYPLAIHRFANAAARALECASASAPPARFVDVAYAKQDSFGLKPWIEYAIEAGVTDTAAFESCVKSKSRVARIDRGRSLGDSMGITGTPTIFINGWRFSSPPDKATLRKAIASLAAGRPLTDED